MRILYLDQHFGTPQGATGSRSYEFSKALAAAGHSVTIVCGAYQRAALSLPKDEKAGYNRGNIDGIDVISLPLPYSNQTGLAKRSLIFFRFALRAIHLSLRLQYDVLFASSTPLTICLPGIAARFFRRKPFIFEVRDLWPDLPRALGMRNPFFLGSMSFLEWAAYRSSLACIGLSPGIVEGIRRRSSPGKIIEMIPNCSDLDLFVPGKREDLDLPGITTDDFVAGFTGAHGIANGLDILIETAAILKDRGSKHIKLVLIGDGKEKPRLVARVKSKGLDNCLFFPPIPRLKLATIVSCFDCGLQILKNIPEFYYGTSPNKFFDYISAGIPVLNNYPGWLADMIQEYQCGVLVEPNNPAELASKLEYLASHPDECILMGKQARLLAENQFSRAHLAQKFISFLEKFSKVASERDLR